MKRQRKIIRKPRGRKYVSVNPFIPAKPMLKPAEVAKALGCSIRHVHELVEEGKLRALEIGLGRQRNHVRIVQTTLIQYCELNYQ